MASQVILTVCFILNAMSRCNSAYTGDTKVAKRCCKKFIELNIFTTKGHTHRGVAKPELKASNQTACASKDGEESHDIFFKIESNHHVLLLCIFCNTFV